MINLVNKTIYGSLLIQLITIIIPLTAINAKLKKSDEILKKILTIETVVQIIEFGFYVSILFIAKNLEQYTPARYFDWFITTPTMLFSTIIFMKYLENKQNNENEVNEKLNVLGFIKDNKTSVTRLFIYNALMLIFGFLGEVKILPLYVSTALGFVFFYLAFKLIYDEYGSKSKEGRILFWFLGVVWSLYGVAAVMPLTIKNVSYNILDIVSKNFYGLFIFYKIKQLSIE